MDRRRNGGAKPRNIELNRERMPFPENNGRTIDEPAKIEAGSINGNSNTKKHIMQTEQRIKDIPATNQFINWCDECSS